MRRTGLVLFGGLAISAVGSSIFFLLYAPLFLVPLPLLVITGVAFALRPLWQQQLNGDPDLPSDILLGLGLGFATWMLMAAEIALVAIVFLSLLWPALTSIGRMRWRVAGFWFRAAAMWTSALAGAVFEWGLRGAYFAVRDPPRLPSGEIVRVAPVPFLTDDTGQILAHEKFHDLSGVGFVLMGAVLLIAVAWGLRWEGARWARLSLFVGGLPLVAFAMWAGQLYGYAHDTPLFAALWFLSMMCVVVGTVLKR